MCADTAAEVCYLLVKNVTGLAEERGFCLFWTTDGRHLTPALGYATSIPFTTQGEAVGYGFRVWDERAKRNRQVRNIEGG